MTAGDLLWACRTLAGRLRLIGMDVVEVIPTGVGSADITALVAARIVHEALTGLAASPLRDRQLAASGAGVSRGVDRGDRERVRPGLQRAAS
jgi:Arginase family